MNSHKLLKIEKRNGKYPFSGGAAHFSTRLTVFRFKSEFPICLSGGKPIAVRCKRMCILKEGEGNQNDYTFPIRNIRRSHCRSGLLGYVIRAFTLAVCYVCLKHL